MLFAVVAGCSTFDPKHPLVGKPKLAPDDTAIWLWHDEGRWHVRLTGSKQHRFQGSVTGVGGIVSEMWTTKPQLATTVAIVGGAVQFDVEAPTSDLPSGEGFDAHVTNNCARFDFYLDGHHRPEHIRLGPRGTPAHHVPFERCP
jgi:hypothetical protein